MLKLAQQPLHEGCRWSCGLRPWLTSGEMIACHTAISGAILASQTCATEARMSARVEIHPWARSRPGVDGKGRLSVPFVRRGLMDLGGRGRNSARAEEPVCRRLSGGSNGHPHLQSGRYFGTGQHHRPGHRADQTRSGW